MSSQLRPVVVGVDGSSRSDEAVRWAAKVAAGRRWPLRLVHAVWATEADFGPISPGIESLFSRAVESGERMLEDARRLVAEVSTDLDVTVSMPNTSPAVALIDQARDARLVVVGATGGHAFVDMVLGSTAYAVTRHVHTPVAVIRGYAENIEPSTTLPVVVGVDGSEASEQAVGLAFEEAATRGAPLIAVHAWTDLSLNPPRELSGIGVAEQGGWPLIRQNGDCLGHRYAEKKAIREMQLCHIPKVTAVFDEPNLIGSAGLVPAMLLARRAGLDTLVTGTLTVPGGAGADAGAKVSSIVAGMLTGADSINDMDVLREGAVHKVLPGVKAPSTLGTFLRAFTFGHVRQLGAVAAGLLTALAGLVKLLPSRAEQHRDAVTWLDVDDTMRETHGYAKQGVDYGYNKVKGLNALLAVGSTATTAPIIVAHRLRKGAVNSARGGGKFLADAIAATRRAGAAATIICRLDSAFYNHSVVSAVLTAKARFSITARLDTAVTRAIAGIHDHKWVPIKYPNAIYDEAEQRWISDAEVAEVDYTAFTSKKKKEQVTARLIVRRVKRLNPTSAPQGQTELFSAWRHHAVFTNSTEPMLTAEAHHRDHAIVEQVIADLKSSALAHFPSGRFHANGAWLTCAVIAYNLTRAVGALTGGQHRKARTMTIRNQLINIPARVAYSALTYTLHLPANSTRRTPFITMFNAVQAPPRAA